MTNKTDLKFRAWDKIYKKISYNFSFIGDEYGINEISFYKDTDFVDKNKFEVMQYSGKKDINKKPIYEGDIIEFEEPMFESEMIKGYVVLKNAAFIVKCGKEKFELRDIREPEIVGNIFENPKFLK